MLVYITFISSFPQHIVKQEIHLGVVTSNNLKLSDQSSAANKKTNMMLSAISRNFYHKSPGVIKKLYNIYVATPRICNSILITELH